MRKIEFIEPSFEMKPTGRRYKVLSFALSALILIPVITEIAFDGMFDYNTFFNGKKIEHITVYIFAYVLIGSLLRMRGYKQEKIHKKDKELYPNKYKILDDNYQGSITIDDKDYYKIDTYRYEFYYVILRHETTNQVAIYDLDTDTLKLCDEAEKTTIIKAYIDSIPTESFYIGGLLSHFFINLWAAILVIVSLGLLTPYVICKKQRYKASRTYISGEKMVFRGKSMQLFGKFLLWWFLSIITFGLFMLFMITSVKKWTIFHTHFVKVDSGISVFEGNPFGYVFRIIGVFLLNIITLGIASFWSHCAMERYLAKNTVIDGVRLKFDGKGTQYFGKRILWIFLTIITLGIYSFWLTIKTTQWTVKHTVFDNLEDKKQILGIFNQRIILKDLV